MEQSFESFFGGFVYVAKGVLHLLDHSCCASFLHFEHMIKGGLFAVYPVLVGVK